DVYVAPKQCGPESKIKLTVVKRDARKLREAMQEFAAAAREFNKVKDDKEATGGARYYYALGKFAEANVAYEEFLDIKFPENLNFGDGLPENKKKNGGLAKQSMKRFEEWRVKKTKAAEAANKKFEAVLAIRDNANSIAA